MSDPLHREIATLIVTTLNLDIAPETIQPDEPLFHAGLGLDSIDALELSLALSKTYGFTLKPDDKRNAEIFASLRSLSEHVARHRQT